MNHVLATNLIEEEYLKASQKHPPFHSAHEGLGVIWEEFEELKAEVFKRTEKRDRTAMRDEAIQVGAMALKFLVDLCKL